MQRAAEKVEPYVGREGVLVQPQEVFGQENREQQEEVEGRPVRESRPPRGCGEE